MSLTDVYPVPNTVIIFAKLKNAKIFVKINFASAYHQMALDEDANNLLIINTTKGLYRLERLQIGMKNASVIFNM